MAKTMMGSYNLLNILFRGFVFFVGVAYLLLAIFVAIAFVYPSSIIFFSIAIVAAPTSAYVLWYGLKLYKKQNRILDPFIFGVFFELLVLAALYLLLYPKYVLWGFLLAPAIAFLLWYKLKWNSRQYDNLPLVNIFGLITGLIAMISAMFVPTGNINFCELISVSYITSHYLLYLVSVLVSFFLLGTLAVSKLFKWRAEFFSDLIVFFILSTVLGISIIYFNPIAAIGYFSCTHGIFSG